MLSPGKDHALVPRDLGQNALHREALLLRCKEDRAFRKGTAEICRHDLIFWVNSFVWQCNPKKKGELSAGPFVAWDFQDEAFHTMLWCVEHDEDLLIEKSRQMGASWMMVVLFVWLWLFHDWKVLLFISRNEKAVEDESPNSLFWKIDFVLSYLPDWMQPKAFRRRKLFFGNDDRASSIFGEASTGQANVGGNTTAMAIDEFSQIKEDYEVLHRTSDSTGCRIFNGTHLGLDTAFYELSQRVDMKKLVMHWTQHPEYSRGLYRSNLKNGLPEILDKTFPFHPDFDFVLDGTPTGGPFPGLRSPWYDLQCKRKGHPSAVAKDLDINPEGTVSQFFNPVVTRELIERYCRPADWTGSLEYDQTKGLPVKLSSDAEGLLRCWFYPDKDGKPPVAPYGAGADISAGEGATPSVLTIANGRTGAVALELATSNMRPERFATLCVAICRLFVDEDNNPAKLCWESPGPGKTFGTVVIELGFRNIQWHTDDTNPMRKHDRTEKPGWYPGTGAKRFALEQYRGALEQRQFVHYSVEALEECRYWSYGRNGDVEHSGADNLHDASASGVNHGDRTIAAALCYKMVKDYFVLAEKQREEEVRPNSFAGRRLHRELLAHEEAWG